ncbi:MarR family winged helix-turn-helix transcriptional regulator [Aureimonas leprariae]|uniref:MarR family transcriptional regulator n=1 Tax=Plantimonas leprariae TaxID=2615207 RepID=A0A7V7PKM3_9HYPH|nr:MarR family transcriptional regulator [Aureimonas leprariae]KAB0676444.1 MarR family transcriptional regulator [Aureimonas leprariae]
MPSDVADLFDLFETASLGSPRNAIGFVMWRVIHRYERELEQALRPLDLTHLQFTLLALAAWTRKQGEVPSQAELARAGDIHVMQVSNVLKALESKALIARSAAEGNATAKSVVLTVKGLETLRAAFPIAIEVQHRLFGEAGRPGGTLLEALVELDRR